MQQQVGMSIDPKNGDVVRFLMYELVVMVNFTILSESQSTQITHYFWMSVRMFPDEICT